MQALGYIVKEVDFTMSEAGDEFSFNPDMSFISQMKATAKKLFLWDFCAAQTTTK